VHRRAKRFSLALHGRCRIDENLSPVRVRVWLIVALVGHFAARIWSFAYFIPRALRFERLEKLTPEDMRSAHRWVILSRCRPFLEALSIASLAFALTHLASTVTSR
jgi:hypothetical protein